MNKWEYFGKYVGIQGVMSLALFSGYIYSAIAMIPLPEGYTELMSLVTGFYFAKNGVGIISAIKG